jgi:hypothetical protein
MSPLALWGGGTRLGLVRVRIKMGALFQPDYQRSSWLGPGLLVIVGLIALLIEAGHLNAFHLLHWYIRWWPELLIGAGLLALGEWWFDRDHYCSNAQMQP